ncbi:hypothetical protein PVL29_021125 [Vitis rotundifolia]|uniref:Band 7 domain-containing protein n=1 Tax=Vitis rotundifolia TaxID=103349 RepID=A0AA38YZ59_VITRO|nr:hypothetical protein PVL29_021125 [Vitis rotundifolia]
MGNLCCVACVDQATIGVVERWGRFEKLAQPGFHFFNPLAGECLAGLLSTRISSLDVRIETKTKDNVFVQMLCSIQYRVIKENADDAFYELQNPKEQIQAFVFDVVRAHVPRMTLDELFEQKGDVAQTVLEELEKVMGAYGYNIEHILMVDIIPDAAVRKAMNEINAACMSHVTAPATVLHSIIFVFQLKGFSLLVYTRERLKRSSKLRRQRLKLKPST